MKKEIKEKYCFSSRIRIKPAQLDFIKKEKKKLKFRTLAGTLDYIINKYKNEKNKF